MDYERCILANAHSRFCLAATRIWIAKVATFGVGLMWRLRAGADEGPAECGLSPLSFQAGQGWPDGIGTYRPLPGGTMRVLPPAAEWLAGPGPLAAGEVVSYVVSAAVWAPFRQLMVADPHGREIMISCGAALFNARIALRSLGFVPETRVVPDPGQASLVAPVTWRRQMAPTEYEQRLFSHVPRRRTHRGGFHPLPVSAELLTALTMRAERYGATLSIVADQGARAALAAAAETAERAQRLIAGGSHG